MNKHLQASSLIYSFLKSLALTNPPLNTIRFQSNALWPKGVCFSPFGDDISTDKHSSYEAAREVCSALEREGFGGERKHFPVMTWVSGIQNPPRIPKNLQGNGGGLEDD